jgi:hypothetical protein
MTRATQSELRLAKRMARLGTETAFEVLVRARALEAKGKEIIHLEIGEPDFDTPANVVDSGVEALRTGWTHYGPLKMPAAAVESKYRPKRLWWCPAESQSFSSPCSH